jgi:predicted alpha/beta hydrolase
MQIAVQATDGHRFELRWHPAAAAGGWVVLFLPALGVPAEKYDRFAQALAALGVGVAVPDWRGIASSSLRAARGSDWGYAQLLRFDLPAARDALAKLAPDHPCAIGGHSLGGQLAVLSAALAPERHAALLLVATGVPHAATFRGVQAFGVRLFAWSIGPLTRAFGYFPGKRLRWAGVEAATLMRQWAGTVRRGRYDRLGIDGLEARVGDLALPAMGMRFTGDALAPADSLAALIAKLGPGNHAVETFDAARLGDVPDHFRWMKSPAAPADAIAAWLHGIAAK